VEGLAEGIAELCLNKLHVKALTVRVEKPRALLVASSAGVEIRRSIYKEEVIIIIIYLFKRTKNNSR